MVTETAPEEAVAFGLISVTLGGQPRLLRTRKIASAREWKARMAATLGVSLGGFDIVGRGGGDSIASLLSLSAVGSEAITDLVVDYDTEGDLGGRDWIEAHADETEVYVVFRAILERHFPFVRDVLGMMRELARLMADTPILPVPAPSPPANSANGHSPTGISGLPKSKRGSTRRS